MNTLSIDEKSFAVMTKDWQTAREVWQQIDDDCKLAAVAAALVRLWKAGRIQRSGDIAPACAIPAPHTSRPMRALLSLGGVQRRSDRDFDGTF